MTENTPSSVEFGSRQTVLMIVWYSSGVMPWLATSSGVTAGWANFSTAASDMGGCPLRAGRGDRSENLRAVLAAEKLAAGVFRVRHEAEDVAPLVADAGDIFQRAVGIGGRRRLAFGVDVAQQNLPVFAQALQGRRVGVVTAFAVLDRHFEQLAFF